MGLVYNPLYLKLHTFICLRKDTFFPCRPPAIALGFLESVDLVKKCPRAWDVQREITRMAVISTRQGEKHKNDFYGSGILLFMTNLYSDALNASVATLGIIIVEAICKCLDP